MELESTPRMAAARVMMGEAAIRVAELHVYGCRLAPSDPACERQPRELSYQFHLRIETETGGAFSAGLGISPNVLPTLG